MKCNYKTIVVCDKLLKNNDDLGNFIVTLIIHEIIPLLQDMIHFDPTN